MFNKTLLTVIIIVLILHIQLLHAKPKSYSVIIFRVYGAPGKIKASINIEGIGTYTNISSSKGVLCFYIPGGFKDRILYAELTIEGKWYISLHGEPTYTKVYIDGRRRWIKEYPEVLYLINISDYPRNISRYYVKITLIKDQEYSLNGTTYTFYREIELHLRKPRLFITKPVRITLDNPFRIRIFFRNLIFNLDNSVFVCPPEAPEAQVLLSMNVPASSGTYSDEYTFNVSLIDLPTYGGFFDLRTYLIRKIGNVIVERYGEMVGLSRFLGVSAKVYEYKLHAIKGLLNASCYMSKSGSQGFNTALTKAVAIYFELRSSLRHAMLQSFLYMPMVIACIFIFSSIISKIFIEKRRYIVTALVFIAILMIMFTYSYEFRLFIYTWRELSEPYSSLQLIPGAIRYNYILAGAFTLLLGLFASVFFSYIILSSDRLNYTYLIFKRRKLRLALIIVTVSIVSSAVIVHGAFISGPVEKVSYRSQYSEYYFITFYGYLINRKYIQTVDGIVLKDLSKYTYLSLGEYLWISNFSSDSNVVAKKIVKVSYGDKTTYLNAYALNLSFTAKYLEFYRYVNGSINGALLSSRAFNELNVSIGNSISVDGISYVVSGYFNYSIINLKDLDGDPLFRDPVKGVFEAPDLIVPLNAIDSTWAIIKISIILNSLNDISKALTYIREGGTVIRGIAEPDGFNIVGYTYSCLIGGEGGIVERVYVDLQGAIVGDWIVQAVIVAISVLMISINALASSIERRREFKTISCLGANPSYIIVEVISEGASIGIISGLLGYFVGEILVFAYWNILGTATMFPRVHMGSLVLALLVSMISTIMGYLLPARNAIKNIIPSQLIERRKGKFIRTSSSEIKLTPIIKLKSDELNMFKDFMLTRFVRSLNEEGLYGIRIYDVRLIEDEKVLRIVMNGYFKSPFTSKNIELKIITILRLDEEMLQPVFVIKSKYLNLMFSSDLINLINRIREALMEYISFKKEKLFIKRIPVGNA